jgi:organic hydroperoxide reductase OsmC/OhrA
MALQPLYEASATVTSGREGFGETSDGGVKAMFNLHQICPYANATRGNIDVQLTAK